MILSAAMNTLHKKVIALTGPGENPSIVKKTVLSNDYLNVFIEYTQLSRAIFSSYKELASGMKSMKAMIHALKTLRFFTYITWIQRKDKPTDTTMQNAYFFEYYILSCGIDRIYKAHNEELTALNGLVKELKKLRLLTYSDWRQSKENADGHLEEYATSIKKIDNAIKRIQELIDQDWQEKKLFLNFKEVIGLYNDEILGEIAPERKPEPKELAYTTGPQEENDIVFF